MFYHFTFVIAILLSSSCIADAANETYNASFSEILSTALNSKANYSDYLSIIKEKCETEHQLLTSYEQECCMKIANAKAHVPFSIIRQNTDIMQFTNEIDPSLFQILLGHFSNNAVSDGDVPNASVETRTSSSPANEQDLNTCLTDKAACLEELGKSSLLAQQSARLEVEIEHLRHTVQRQMDANIERESEVRILTEQHENDQKEIIRLTAQLESLVQRLTTEEQNTMTLISERERCTAELGVVEHSLSTCQSSLVGVKEDLVTEQGSLAKCSSELTALQGEQATVAAMEQHVITLQTENTKLRGELEQSQQTVDEKDAELAKCAEIEPLLVMCQQRLGHCHNSSSETDQQWQDKFDDCYTQLNTTKTLLNHEQQETMKAIDHINRLMEASASCNANYTALEDANGRLLTDNAHLQERLTTATSTIEGQSKALISLGEQLEECSNHNERTEVVLLSIKNELSIQLESYTRLQVHYHEQSNKTLLAEQARDACQMKLAETELDYQGCSHNLQASRAEVNNISSVAEHCLSGYRDCSQQLEIALVQIQNCSSSAELASWKTLHEQCRAENIQCESSKTELASNLKAETEQKDICHQKLNALRLDEAQCQTTNSELRSSLTMMSDAHADIVLQLQELSAKEASCQLALTEARQSSLQCQETAAELQSAKDQCLAELNHETQQLAIRDAALAELSTTYGALSASHETCQQERHAAITHVSTLNVTVTSCHRIVDELTTDVLGLGTELDKCLHSKNLTHANMTEWQQRHDRCMLGMQAAEERYLALTEQCESWRLRGDDLQLQFDTCVGQRSDLLTQQQSLLYQVEQLRVSTTLLNQSVTDCHGRLQLKTAEALQYQTSEEATRRLLGECTVALHACQNPPVQPCPATDGNNTYHGVDLTAGRDDVISAEELTGCYMASYDSAEGRSMKHFCHAQEGHLFKVTDARTMDFAKQVVEPHQGKFLVEPSAYLVSALGLDLKHYASNDEICYYIDGSEGPSAQLQHDKCAGQVFHAMCWTAYQPGQDYEPVVLPDRDPDYLDYSQIDDNARVPDYLDYSQVDHSQADQNTQEPDFLDYSQIVDQNTQEPDFLDYSQTVG